MGAFYQSEIVKLIPSGNASGVLVPNVQSVSTAFQVQRVDTMRLGRFAPTPYRQANQDPLINVNLDFIPTGSDIFSTLGLLGSNSAVEMISSGTQRVNDMRIQIRELVGGGGAVGTFNLKSGVLTNFAFSANVGQTPRTTISLEFLDIAMDATTAVVPPNIDDGYPTLRPQDIDISLPSGIFGIGSVYPQSFTMTLPLNRTPIFKLGSRKPVSRGLTSPIMASFQVQATIDTFASTSATSGFSMFNLTCGAPLDGDIVVNVKRPTCTGESSQSLVKYTLRKPYLDNVNYSNSVGGYTSVDMQFTIPVTPDNIATESNLVIS